MQKVLLVAIVKPFHQLSHETAYVFLGELNQAGLQKAHQVMVHVLKHQIEGTLTQGAGHRQQVRDHIQLPYISNVRHDPRHRADYVLKVPWLATL